MKITKSQMDVLDTILKRPYYVKMEILKDERTPKMAKKYLEYHMFTPKQKDVLRLMKKKDKRMIIHHGGTRSGKTYINNFIFLRALKQVREEADKLMGKSHTPSVILAAYKNENIDNNILDPLRNDFGITINKDKSGNFHLLGVKVVTTYTKDRSGLSAIKGMTAWFAYVNEAALANKKAFEEIDNRLSGGKQPFLILDTNPEHPHHWLKTGYIDRAYELNEDRNNNKKAKGYYTIHSTPLDNPYVSESYVESIYARPEGPGRDRALGFWTTGEGAVYSHFDPKHHYITKNDLPPRSEFKEYFVGVDWGDINPTSFVLFGRADVQDEVTGEFREVTYLLKEISKPGAKTGDLLKTWQDLAKKWMEEYGRNIPFYCDHDPLKVRALLDVGANAENGHKHVGLGIESVSELIQGDQFYVVEEEVSNFKEEIGAYEWNKTKGAPRKEFDHTMDAIRYAIYTHKEMGQPFSRYG